MATNEDIIATCAAMGAEVRNISTNLIDIKKSLEKSADMHAQTTARLAVIERLQNDMKESVNKYQGECDRDRTSMDKRLTSVEGFQGRQIKYATGVSSFVAMVVTGAIEYFKKS